MFSLIIIIRENSERFSNDKPLLPLQIQVRSFYELEMQNLQTNILTNIERRQKEYNC